MFTDKLTEVRAGVPAMVFVGLSSTVEKTAEEGGGEGEGRWGGGDR